jgi:hypothetical protein
MGKPTLCHMVAYLKRIGITLKPLTKEAIESAYYRSIYQVLPREQTLQAIAMRPHKHYPRR